jgi:hypothetical protein
MKRYCLGAILLLGICSLIARFCYTHNDEYSIEKWIDNA